MVYSDAKVPTPPESSSATPNATANANPPAPATEQSADKTAVVEAVGTQPESVSSTQPHAVDDASCNAVKLCALNHIPFVKAGDEAPVITMLHLDAPKLANVEERKKALCVSAVIDVSGSMRGDKLRLAKESLLVMAAELGPNDKFGIIAFETDIHHTLPLTTMDLDGKAAATVAIEHLTHMENTNLSEGLLAGLKQARGLPFPSSTPRSPVCEKVVVQLPISHVQTEAEGKYTYQVTIAQCPGVSSVSVGSSLLPHKSGFDVMWDPVDTLVPFVDVRVQFVDAQRPPETLCYKMNEGTGSATFPLTMPSSVATAPAETTATAVEALQSLPDGAAHIVLLFTDGQANQGVTNPSELIKLTKDALKSHPTDVVVHTFGYGPDHNAALLQGIAESSQGTYYYIKDTESMKSSFADCLGGILSIVCTGIVVEVETTAGFSIHEIKTTFPKVTKSDGVVEISMKDLYSEEKRDIVVLLKPTAPMAVIADVHMVKFTVRCDNSISGKKESVTANATLTVANEAYTGAPNEEVEKQVVRNRITEALAEARRAADSGDLDGARRTMNVTQAYVQSSTTYHTPYVAHMSNELYDVERTMASQHRWQEEGTQCASKAYSQHCQQRCNTSAGEFGLYANDHQTSMRSKHGSNLHRPPPPPSYPSHQAPWLPPSQTQQTPAFPPPPPPPTSQQAPPPQWVP